MKYLFFAIFYFFTGSLFFAQSNIIKDGDVYYFADRIIIKYKSETKSLGKSIDPFFSKYNIESKSPTFVKSQKETNQKGVELDNIYTLKFSSPYNPIYLAKEILKNKNIEWAEPHYLYELAYDPNDPVYNDTDTLKVEHLDLIKANSAWDINKGSEDVIIAIVDTGVDWLHEDLAANIWVNSDEIENNGIDDDENGFIDDIRGWDFGGENGTADNDPNEDRADHGTHVAGLSSAVTDNGIGIASIGFKTKIMPVKTSRNDLRNDLGTALIAYGYEGIKYAADNGADIINCSWGGYNNLQLHKPLLTMLFLKEL
jgi:serine protease